MKIGILNYEACNIASIYYSLYRLGYDPIVLNKPGVINKLDKLIIPGVGAAKKCMDFMNSSSIKDEIINFFDKGKPILGI
jgi:glutamine amidotransferase